MGNTVEDPSLTKLHILTFQPVIISIVSPSRLYFLSLTGSLFLLLPCCLTPIVVANELSASLIFQNFAYCSQIDLFKGITNHVTIILKSLSHNSSSRGWLLCPLVLPYGTYSDLQVGSPLSTNSQVPSPSVRVWEVLSCFHPEQGEDMLLGNTVAIDAEMYLLDPPSRKYMLPNCREFMSQQMGAA